MVAGVLCFIQTDQHFPAGIVQPPHHLCILRWTGDRLPYLFCVPLGVSQEIYSVHFQISFFLIVLSLREQHPLLAVARFGLFYLSLLLDRLPPAALETVK